MRFTPEVLPTKDDADGRPVDLMEFRRNMREQWTAVDRIGQNLANLGLSQENIHLLRQMLDGFLDGSKQIPDIKQGGKAGFDEKVPTDAFQFLQRIYGGDSEESQRNRVSVFRELAEKIDLGSAEGGMYYAGGRYPGMREDLVREISHALSGLGIRRSDVNMIYTLVDGYYPVVQKEFVKRQFESDQALELRAVLNDIQQNFPPEKN